MLGDLLLHQNQFSLAPRFQNMIGVLCRLLAILQRNWCRFAAWPAVSIAARFRQTWIGCEEVMNSNNVEADDFLRRTFTDLRSWKMEK